MKLEILILALALVYLILALALVYLILALALVYLILALALVYLILALALVYLILALALVYLCLFDCLFFAVLSDFCFWMIHCVLCFSFRQCLISAVFTSFCPYFTRQALTQTLSLSAQAWMSRSLVASRSPSRQLCLSTKTLSSSQTQLRRNPSSCWSTRASSVQLVSMQALCRYQPTLQLYKRCVLLCVCVCVCVCVSQ